MLVCGTNTFCISINIQSVVIDSGSNSRSGSIVIKWRWRPTESIALDVGDGDVVESRSEVSSFVDVDKD